MTRDQRKDIVEAIGLIAIVVSLVFVALEVRQANVATRIAARDSASQGQIDYMTLQISPETLSTAARKSFVGEELNPDERAQLRQFHMARWRHYERVYFLHLYDVISDGEWQGYENGILRAFETPGDYWEESRDVWDRDKVLMSEQFVEYVQTLNQNAR